MDMENQFANLRPPAPREILRVWTDGSCTSAQGVYFFGGWGFVLKYGDQMVAAGGSSDIDGISSARMELLAAIKALEFIDTRFGSAPPRAITIHSDSTFLVNGMRESMPEIIKNRSHFPLDELDLFHRIWALSSNHFVQWKWVRGHSGVEENELADKLAVNGSNSAYTNWREEFKKKPM